MHSHPDNVAIFQNEWRIVRRTVRVKALLAAPIWPPSYFRSDIANSHTEIHFNFAYSAFAAITTGISVSASFHSVRKS